ncbi:FadR family transcriptional regulator, partial [Xanthomonas sp. Kuri4-2]
MSENRLYQTIVAKILKLIESGEFPPGARLPGERDLAERFGVSRVTVREAEIALEAQGWIAIKTGSGVYVRARPGTAFGDLPDVSAFDLTAARAVFESEAAALAADRAGDDE